MNQLCHQVLDLKFFNGGMKRWVTRIVSWRYECLKCNSVFNSEARSPHPAKYGHGLMSWFVYGNVVCGMNMLRVEKSLGDIFGFEVAWSQAYRSKTYIADLYQSLYPEILKSILASPVIHIDETTVRLRKQAGYVWVMTSMEKAFYFCKASREGSFLQEMLGDFSGVLVSDFFTAYDSLACEQQKCLVHLLRDIDDDLLRNPLDSEFKNMAQTFANLLRTIIEAVDRFGLKRRHLHKHKRAATRFLDSVASTDFSSQLAMKYKKRFQKKSGEKMFTFLDHDGVPWEQYQRRACRQTIREIPQAGRWLLYGAEPAGVPRTGKRVRNLRVQHSQILAFERGDVGRAIENGRAPAEDVERSAGER